MVYDPVALLQSAILEKRDIRTTGNRILNSYCLSSHPIRPFMANILLDRLSLVFDIHPEKQDDFHNMVGDRTTRIVKRDNDDYPYYYTATIPGTCHFAWGFKFHGMESEKGKEGTNWARVEFFGEALYNGEAKAIVDEILIPCSPPDSYAISRIDIAIDYISKKPLSPLLVPFDSQVQNVRLQYPNCPTLKGYAANTRHGGKGSPRIVRDYDKTIERCDWGFSRRECFGHVLGKFEHCQFCMIEHRGKYVHRCEVVLRPHTYPRSDRNPRWFLDRCDNPFGSHHLIHLGVVDEVPWKYILVAGRELGLVILRTELIECIKNKRTRDDFRSTFDAKMEDFARASSKILRQPKQIFEDSHAVLQQDLNTILGV